MDNLPDDLKSAIQMAARLAQNEDIEYAPHIINHLDNGEVVGIAGHGHTGITGDLIRERGFTAREINSNLDDLIAGKNNHTNRVMNVLKRQVIGLVTDPEDLEHADPKLMWYLGDKDNAVAAYDKQLNAITGKNRY